MIATKKLKYPPAEEALLPRRELPTFRELYLAAFTGLHAQFTHSIWADQDTCAAYVSCAGLNEAPLRSKAIAKIAYNSAMEACRLLEEKGAIENFNKKV